MKRSICSLAAFSLLWLLPAVTHAQVADDVFLLPALELGEVVAVDGFVGKQNKIDVHIEFENGTFDGIWGNGSASIINISTDDGVQFRTVWNGGGGAMVTLKSFGANGVPQVDDWFGGVWRSNTSPPSPAEMLDLFLDDDVSVVDGAPLLLGIDESGLRIVVDLGHVHTLTGILIGLL